MKNFRFPTISIWIGGVIIALVLLAVFLQPHFYLFTRVEPSQIGVRIEGGRIVEILPPGVYSDFGLFVRLETYSAQSYQFSVTDAELITSDNQRLGVTVSGSVFRPDFKKADRIADLWTRYKTIYTNDVALQAVANDLAAQAMKVCVGDRPFRDSIIGTARDDLRKCIDSELSGLADPYGLDIQNVTVPNVLLSPEVQALLDSITKSRLETEKADQDKLRAVAEGLAQQAEQEANIRVEQSRIQEEARQKTLLAELSRQQLEAERKVIESQKANDLLSAQKDLEINKAQAAAAAEKANADLARETALAALYAGNPNYYQLQVALANASAIKSTDKIIYIPSGTIPQLVISQGNLTPVVPVTPNTTPTPAPTTP
jgi:hypothetical protein